MCPPITLGYKGIYHEDKYAVYVHEYIDYLREQASPQPDSYESDSRLSTVPDPLLRQLHPALPPTSTATMPSTIIHNSTLPTSPSTVRATATFTGEVYMDRISPSTDGIMSNHVTFLPGSRTFWHRHENGQILEVKAGSGWVCDRGGVPQRIRTGDLVQCPAGTVHWHGADEGSLLVHLAVSLGKTTWLEEVSQEEFERREG